MQLMREAETPLLYSAVPFEFDACLHVSVVDKISYVTSVASTDFFFLWHYLLCYISGQY